jgi:hypothetical protein
MRRIRKVRKDHGSDIGIAAFVVLVVAGYAMWGSFMLSREQARAQHAHSTTFAENI